MSADAPISQKLPAVHAAHDDAPAEEYEPAAHTVHAAFDVAPVLADDVPAGHCSAAGPVPGGQYVPATEQAAPVDTPTDAQNCPAGHGLSVADVLPVPTQKPAAHAPVHDAVVRPVVLPYVPEGQGVGSPALARQ